ncbi:response regulator [Brevundimonas bacteroides]|uniref:response regulator n=1 Tax=Brevundimonas bacteroides TaxID=74311 RepID=UPI000494F7BF|nr:response regulator [Brevundimonas bacteroides]
MAAASRIIIVEDDPEIRSLVRALLVQEGYVCEAAEDAERFWRIAAIDAPDLVILDIMMPGEDGLSLCRRLRAQSDVPVLITSARAEPLDRVIGLEIGADDYLSKPFEPRELIARTRALLRRTRSAPRQRGASFGGWRVDYGARSLTSPEGEIVELTSGEFDLLAVLTRHPLRVLSRDDIMDALHGRSADAFDRSIDIQVSRLRRKLRDDPRSPQLIRTVRNAGYLFAVQPEAS